MPEFGQHGLEVLRQPLDPAGKSVTISRAQGSLTFPGQLCSSARKTHARAVTGATRNTPARAALS